ncbi:hypothetical protein ES319_A08G108800v1 [Gossypium barbadense]|uniref:NERD domain-containing protein n=2 Tax=Gossypium TaxID=3633 RepID=A0A2P5YA71_GOSBA|nr:hypothetical protein ES319_A08G108800v1 [Gossypium barbadense]PPS12479.1 hypothetical protein GOBAR_AA08162 [Gossypium barbadense]TYH05947.1 hypothetical protein ES288_A08G119500v1 [Gossypium darwinii]
MWLEIIYGIIIYQFFRRFFYGGNDVLDVETSDFNAIFSTEKLCGGKVYVGLNTPDANTGSRKSIDIVLVTKGEATVISVKNVSGFVSINDDGSWTSKGGRSHRKERISDPVITYDQWVQLEREPKGMIFGWVNGAFCGGKKEMHDSFHQQLNFILSTTFIWDRLELKGSKHVLGEFLEFKGKQEDSLASRNIIVFSPKKKKKERLL